MIDLVSLILRPPALVSLLSAENRKLMSLDICWDIQMVGSEFGVAKHHESMDLSCLISVVQAAGVMLWMIFSWHTLGQ